MRIEWGKKRHVWGLGVGRNGVCGIVILVSGFYFAIAFSSFLLQKVVCNDMGDSFA